MINKDDGNTQVNTGPKYVFITLVLLVHKRIVYVGTGFLRGCLFILFSSDVCLSNQIMSS